MKPGQFTFVTATGCLLSLVLVGSTDAQRFGAPQATALHQTDDYRVMAMPLSPGQAIVKLTNNGILQPLLVVQPYELTAPTAASTGGQRPTRDTVQRRNRRDRQEPIASHDLIINGTEQRIVGLAFDERYMYAAVGGYKLPDTENIEVSVQTEVPTRPAEIRLMLHIYDHRSGIRLMSHELDVPGSFQLAQEDLSQGPLLTMENGISFFESQFEMESNHFVILRDARGQEMRIPTELRRLRMRDV